MKLATDVASRAVASLEGAGVFAVELFLTEDGEVYTTSQFFVSFFIYFMFMLFNVNVKLHLRLCFMCFKIQILLNEVAPRPHNSGHHTIESCYTSQYEQHLRAVVGLPLGDPSMKAPASMMYNILGEDEV